MDIIQKIPVGLEKYLGVDEMVLPCEETIRKELKKVDKGKLVTLPKLRESIARQFGVTTSCPKSTLKTVRSIMQEQNSGAYRVVNGKGSAWRASSCYALGV